jgi:hypothetical protein
VTSPTGTLLGESEPIATTSDEMPASHRVALQPATGVHDVYFVFTNPDPRAGFLSAVLTAMFEATAPTARSALANPTR